LELEATVLDQRAAPLFVHSYRCEAPLWPFAEERGMNEAAQDCAARLLADLAPKQIARKLPLDTSDPLAAPGVEACESQRFDEALRKFTEASEKAPQSAALVYNRGVLSLWKGEFEEASKLLSQAVEMKPGDGAYAEAKEFSHRAAQSRRR